MAKNKIGTMPCEGQRCPSHERAIPAVIFVNERDTLSYQCDWCGRSPYAKAGTGQHAEWLGELIRFVPVKEPERSPQPASVAPVEPSAEDSTAAIPAPIQTVPTKKAGLSWSL